MANICMLLIVLLNIYNFQVQNLQIYNDAEILSPEYEYMDPTDSLNQIGETESPFYSADPNLNNEDIQHFDLINQNPRRITTMPWWSNYLVNLINSFRRQATRVQYGVLYMDNIDVQEAPNLFPTYYPNINGVPIVNNSNVISPPRPSEFANYIAARPQWIPMTSTTHAEDTLLQHRTNLWNAYRRHFGLEPNVVILYSRFIPCTNCTSLILNAFNQEPFASVPVRVVAYTFNQSQYLPYLNLENNRNNMRRLWAGNIATWQDHCTRRNQLPRDFRVAFDVEFSPAAETCQKNATFQGCLMECLKNLCCSCKVSRKEHMLAALVNNLTQMCANADINKCVDKWFQYAFSNPRSGASVCIRIDDAKSKIKSCSKTCFGRPLSEPLNHNFPSKQPKMLTQLTDIDPKQSVDLSSFCDDIRTEGFLCQNYRSDSFTAGNTLCRSDMKCTVHETHLYRWCYVDYSGYWDYCCSSECDYHEGTDYLWCRSGPRWQYCGDAGYFTAKGRRCLPEYPCGMHQERGAASQYWCYYDTRLNWDWCCRPGDKCSLKGASKKWCYSGYQKKTFNVTC